MRKLNRFCCDRETFGAYEAREWAGVLSSTSPHTLRGNATLAHRLEVPAACPLHMPISDCDRAHRLEYASETTHRTGPLTDRREVHVTEANVPQS